MVPESFVQIPSFIFEKSHQTLFKLSVTHIGFGSDSNYFKNLLE